MSTSLSPLSRGGPDGAPGARRRVVVAMSGGVDSSVVAALMRDAGHEVVGITLQLYDHGSATRRPGACCAGEDIHDARRVADRLGIEHYVLDYHERFRASVIAPFAEAYAAGATPVPCIACNREVKFKDLLAFANDLGADRLATGHYVDLRHGPAGPELHRAADEARDQSYFLFATTRAQLARLEFPLAGLTKPEVRRIAGSLGLEVAEKPDSQDICFVPTGSYLTIVERLKPEAHAPGDIVDLKGRVLGRHEGIARFTIGQRRGLKVASGEPLFVVRLEPLTRRVVVGPRSALLIDRLELTDVNWLGDGPLAEAIGSRRPLSVRLRSTGELLPARLAAPTRATGTQPFAAVELEDPAGAAAPGQACVFYADPGPQSRVLGGGFIASTALSGARAAAPADRLTVGNLAT